MSETATYNSSHRALLQSFMAASTFTFDEAKPILASLLTAHEGRPTENEDITITDFENYISTLNRAIEPFEYEIRSARPQTDERGIDAVYALVNMRSDQETQLATTNSVEEMAYIHRLLNAMFDTYNTSEREVMAIKHNQALALSRASGGGRPSTNAGETQATQSAASTGLTKEQASKVLKKLVSEGWFAKSENKYYSLDTRGLLELDGFLKDTFNVEVDAEDMEEGDSIPWQRIKSCAGCKSTITVGQRCAESTCMVRLHDRCVEAFFHGQASKPCPECKVSWTGISFVGERAAARDGGVDTSNRRGSRR